MQFYNYSDFDRLIAVMEQLGQLLIGWRDDASARKMYSKSDFKTEADRRAHQFISDALQHLFPGVPVISEEDTEVSEVRPDKYWLIDPIDGTASWYEGFEGFVTQAAYIESTVPIYGVIHCPAFGKTWTAFRGHGARLNGAPMKRLSEASRLIITDNTKTPHGIAEHLLNVLDVTGYLESGSLGLKSVFVADGTADLFVKNVKVRDWDMAPVAAILHEVGGCITLPDGKPFEFKGPMVKADGVVVARDARLLAGALQGIATYVAT